MWLRITASNKCFACSRNLHRVRFINQRSFVSDVTGGVTITWMTKPSGILHFLTVIASEIMRPLQNQRCEPTIKNFSAALRFADEISSSSLTVKSNVFSLDKNFLRILSLTQMSIDVTYFWSDILILIFILFPCLWLKLDLDEESSSLIRFSGGARQ